MIQNRIAEVLALFCGVVALALAGCGSDRSGDVVPVRIQRLDSAMALFSSSGPEGRMAMVDSFSRGLEAMVDMGMLPSVSDSSIAAYGTSDVTRVFLPDVASRLGSLDSVESALGAMYDRAAVTLPSLPRPEIYGIESPFFQSVYLVDSVALVALNHYLGPDYPGYVSFENYQRQRKFPRLLPYNLLEAQIGVSFPIGDTGVTVLSAMLREGAVIHALMSTVSGASLADAGGWTQEEVEWMEANERLMWEALVDKNLLYSTDPMDVRRLVGSAPSTPLINANAPGAAGRFLGYRIVSSYLAGNPSAQVEQLLSEGFWNSRKSLIESGYGWRR